MDGDYSLLPPYVTAKTIAQIEDCPLPTAESRFKRIRKTLSLKRFQKLGWKDYLENRGMSVKEAIHRHSKMLKLLLIAALSITLAAFGKKLLEYSCEFFRQHKIHWEQHTPTYMKGHTLIKDSASGKTKTYTIEVEKKKPEMTISGGDTFMIDTYIHVDIK